MYRFSRSIYREVAPRIDEHDPGGRAAARLKVLDACEATMRRMACDRRYFARPAKTLFSEIREHFALSQQVYVYMVVERYVGLATEHLEQLPPDVVLDGQVRDCHASTRRGTPCQREPLPGRDYCPSHKHLEEMDIQIAA
ncbi:MAG: hypothetical protein ACXWZ3_10570 [Solirubrobacterales bacterium]